METRSQRREIIARANDGTQTPPSDLFVGGNKARSKKCHLAPYHWAWLVGHPERTAVWLKAKITEGFEVHHVDGDHENNEPGNLVLIEGADHMRLHHLPFARTQTAGRLGAKARMKKISPKLRSVIARHAAMKRWYPHRFHNWDWDAINRAAARRAAV